MKEEDNIKKKLGKENPFQVPEGYFERLASEMMSHLPERTENDHEEEPEVSRWTRLKPFLYLAAMFVGAALIVRVASTDDRMSADKATASTATETTMAMDSTAISDEMLDATIDRVMLDDYSLYVYLSDASAE
ncbi:MAG: hypothetical protein LBN29_06410 [Mediterranea sp.]|jgi:hypothetical protein|nr:hypothetical protein [Mediterranea sp.]